MVSNLCGFGGRHAENFLFRGNLGGQRFNLARRQMTPRAGRQAGQLHRADANAGQSGDGMAERLHHAAYLPVAAFINREFQRGPPGSVGILFAAQQAHILGGLAHAIIQHDPLTQPLQCLGIRHALHFHAVCLRDMVARMGHLEQEIAVVGHKDQTIAISIETPDGAQHGLAANVHQIRHEPPSVRVRARRHDPFGLVQGQIIAPRRLPDHLPVKLHLVFV